MENRNMGLKVLVVILCVLVLGLGGYILYDKVLSDDNELSIDNNNSNIGNDVTNNDVVQNDNEDTDKNCNCQNDVVNKDNSSIKITDVFDAQYDTVVFIHEDSVYYVTNQNECYFDNNEINKVDTHNVTVSKVRLYAAGLDPAVTIYIISEDGKVYEVRDDKAVLIEELSSYNISDIKDISSINRNDELVTQYKVMLSDGTEKTIII